MLSPTLQTRLIDTNGNGLLTKYEAAAKVLETLPIGLKAAYYAKV